MRKFAVRLAFIFLSVLLVSGLSHAQQGKPIPRIGLVLAGPAGGVFHSEVFRQGLRELGYVEGQNIIVDLRWHPAERPDLLPGIAADLVQAETDVLVASSTIEILALKKATSTIPIVMISPSDPVGTGLIESLARPGGNVTGLSWMSRDIIGKRLELLKEVVPNVSRLGDLWNPLNPATQGDFKEIGIAARRLGITLHSAEVREPTAFAGAFSSLRGARVDALIVQVDFLTWTHRKQIVNLALQSRLPTMFFMRDFVDEGGLMSYGGNLADLYRRAAGYVDKILKGANPANLPVEQPTKFELIINLKTAKALGITIPQSILLQADEKIQ